MDTEPAVEFIAFPKIARFHRDVTITEKIDGTNACVVVTENGVYAQSRKRLITPDVDNHGFARWVHEHTLELQDLGPGHHYGEWYGSGIQRRYGLDHKRFALFNTDRWNDPEDRPRCCDVVPVILRTSGDGLNEAIDYALTALRTGGSMAAPGYAHPEGIVIYHHAARQLFKVLLEGDEIPKGLAA